MIFSAPYDQVQRYPWNSLHDLTLPLSIISLSKPLFLNGPNYFVAYKFISYFHKAVCHMTLLGVDLQSFISTSQIKQWSHLSYMSLWQQVLALETCLGPCAGGQTTLGKISARCPRQMKPERGSHCGSGNYTGAGALYQGPGEESCKIKDLLTSLSCRH